jgi:hypothetical protein
VEVAEEHAADAVFLEVERQPADVVRELHELAGHDVLQAVHARDPVADRRDVPHLGHVDAATDAR